MNIQHNNKDRKNDMEHNILNAASELFLQKGYRNTSTTEIARLAGCNQALVYYYYRSKENLFTTMFVNRTEQIFSKIIEPFLQKQDLISTVKSIIEAYFDFLRQNERLAFFLINELIINDDNRNLIVKEFEKNITRIEVFFLFDQQVREEVAKGHVRPLETFDLMMNIISLCVSTLVSKPIIQQAVFGGDCDTTEEYLDHRKQEITNLIINGIKPL